VVIQLSADLTSAMDRRSLPSSGPLDLVDEIALDDDEKAYVAAARAANTLKGYRSDWAEWCSWCAQEGLDPLAGEAEAISKYLVFLAGAGAKVGTMARRLSAMRFAFRMRGRPDPTGAARVVAVWEGIRRTHGAPADQAAPLMRPTSNIGTENGAKDCAGGHVSRPRRRAWPGHRAPGAHRASLGGRRSTRRARSGAFA